MVCPDCFYTNVKATNKERLKLFKHLVLEQAGKLEGNGSSLLQYNSFPYHIDYLPEVSEAIVGKETKLLSVDTGKLSGSETSKHWENSSVHSPVYCSYDFMDTAIGPSIVAYWFDGGKIKELIKIENRTRQKVFPRYMFYDSLNVAIQKFCWKYNAETSFISKLGLSAYPELDSLKIEDHQSVSRNSEFLLLLKDLPSDQNHKSLSENEMVLSYLENSINEVGRPGNEGDGGQIRTVLSYLAKKFIYDYFRATCRTSFCSNDVLDIRNKYKMDLVRKFSKNGDQTAVLNSVRDALLEFEPSLEDKVFAGLTAHKKSERFQGNHGNGVLAHDSSMMPEVEVATTADRDEIVANMKRLERKFSSLRSIVTRNPDLIELKHKIAEVAKYNIDVLILGETGTGKELFAHAFHQISRREGNFVPINCSGIPKDLFESELFGHKKGAFSGAYNDKKGAFEYANNGTLFLDEFGEIPLDLQAKILRAVE